MKWHLLRKVVQSAEPITAQLLRQPQLSLRQLEAVTQAAPQLDQEQVNQDVTNIGVTNTFSCSNSNKQ